MQLWEVGHLQEQLWNILTCLPRESSTLVTKQCASAATGHLRLFKLTFKFPKVSSWVAYYTFSLHSCVLGGSHTRPLSFS